MIKFDITKKMAQYYVLRFYLRYVIFMAPGGYIYIIIQGS